MQSSILTTGLDGYLADEITKQFSNAKCSVFHHNESGNLVEKVHLINPVIIVLGNQTRSMEDGLFLIRKIKSSIASLPVILINRYSSEARAIESFRAGIDDYFKTPVALDELFVSISRLSKKHLSQNDEVKASFDRPMVGTSATMLELKRQLMNMASVDSTVLITGETGTGKELAAEMIHRYSARSTKEFVCVNCAALPENLVESELFGHQRGAFTGAHVNQKGKFVLSSGGTLFLDEIGDMNPVSQAKILRGIEEGCVYPLGATKGTPVDMRIVAATNQDLETCVQEGSFREDLFYRLNVASVRLPPLRERKEDIPELVEQKVNRLNLRYNKQVKGLTREAMTVLLQWNWPGNIRELHNCVEHSFIRCQSKKIDYKDLPINYSKKISYVKPSQVNDKDRLLIALAATDGNKSQAAKQLQWSRMRVYRTLKRSSL